MKTFIEILFNDELIKNYRSYDIPHIGDKARIVYKGLLTEVVVTDLWRDWAYKKPTVSVTVTERKED